MNRRQLIASVAALTTISLAAPTWAQDEPLKVGFIYVGPVGDGGWTYQHDLARQAIEATRHPGTIEIAAAEDETHWCIRVGDTGPGLPQKARDNLFQPFTGGIRKGGTGLGLAIAADLMRGHGGTLDLVRTGGDGTEFCLNLPRHPHAIHG